MVLTPTTPKLDLPFQTRISLAVIGMYIDLTQKKDGTVRRWLANLFPPRDPTPVDDTINSYDVIVNKTSNIWFRVYIPKGHKVEDLPLFAYFHGGGYSLLSADVKMYDDLCTDLAVKFPCVVVSADYRLAPEKKYPTQYQDGIEVLKFLDNPENLAKCGLENANISRCFIAGDSSGGNLAHSVNLSACLTKFEQLKVVGLVTIQPFFGGEERTKSEIELDFKVPFLNTQRTDMFWKALMPEGEEYNRDHPSINVSGPRAVDITKLDYPETMLVVGGFDVLKDWQIKYYEWLQESGKKVHLANYPNMFHDFCSFPELPEYDQLITEMREFVYKLFNKVCSQLY
uniref:probable carboxylesterase 18 n=1 Tax=Erigeron canadensis TaxID=72917 RepID=UPI001CB9AE8C|nr:probable carboxylesterase 18 [Erigeron canadensis]